MKKTYKKWLSGIIGGVITTVLAAVIIFTILPDGNQETREPDLIIDEIDAWYKYSEDRYSVGADIKIFNQGDGAATDGIVSVDLEVGGEQMIGFEPSIQKFNSILAGETKTFNLSYGSWGQGGITMDGEHFTFGELFDRYSSTMTVIVDFNNKQIKSEPVFLRKRL